MPWSKVQLNFEFIRDDTADVSNPEDEIITGFFFDQKCLALYTKNATNFDYLRVFAYNSDSKEFEQQ